MTAIPRTPLDQGYNPGGARWCATHNRLECTKDRRKGRGQCHQTAVRGTDTCMTHVGHSREVAIVKGEARITAWSALGEPALRLDAGMAVLAMLHMTWLRCNAYSEMLRQQVEEGTRPEPGDEDHHPEPTGAEVTASGMVGYQYGAAGKDGTIYAVSEQIRALVMLEAAERDRVVRFAKVAHDMGISDRITGLAERWGDVVVTRLMLVMDSLDLTPEQEARVPDLIQAHLGQIDLGSIGAGVGLK